MAVTTAYTKNLTLPAVGPVQPATARESGGRSRMSSTN